MNSQLPAKLDWLIGWQGNVQQNSHEMRGQLRHCGTPWQLKQRQKIGYSHAPDNWGFGLLKVKGGIGTCFAKQVSHEFMMNKI